MQESEPREPCNQLSFQSPVEEPLNQVLARSSSLKESESMELPPELQYLVSEYMEPQDAFVCMQVSRGWHDSFSGQAFKSVKVLSEGTIKDRIPPEGWMRKFGGLIQWLEICSSITPLQHLLGIADPQEKSLNNRIQPIALFPKLRQLSISGLCTLIEVEKWLLHCPRLEALSVKNVKSLPTTDTDRGIHLLQYCPRLARLDIDNGNESSGSLQVDDLAEIISHCPLSLTEFGLIRARSCCNHRPWFDAVSGFLSGMTVFHTHLDLESWMLKRIWCSCPLLVDLCMSTFDVDDLFDEADVGKAARASVTTTTATTATSLSTAEQEGAPMGAWACTGLKRLGIFRVMWSGSHARNKAAMEHLGLLRDLRSLKILVMSGKIENEDGWRDFFDDYPWPHFNGYSYRYSVEDLRTDPDARRMCEVWPCLEYYELDRWEPYF